MKTAQQEDLQALEQILQERLRSHIPNGDALKIGCAISNETLVVLIQHPPKVEFDPKITFAAIKKNLQSLHPQGTQLVKLYLRVSGQKQAYAKQDFTLQPSELVKTANASQNKISSDLNFEAAQITDTVQSIGQPQQNSEADFSFPAWSEEAEFPVSNDDKILIPQRDLYNYNHASNRRLTNWENNAYSGEQETTNGGFSAKARSLFTDIPKPLLVVGGGVALATLFSSIYMLTRPCAIGECQSLETAQQLNKVASHLTQQANSQPELLEVQRQLVEANNALEVIPRWSFHYLEASQLSQKLYSQSAMVNQVTGALEKAAKAANKGQNLPHSLQEWQEIQTLWQSAIATLANIPANSVLYPLAQKKLVEYQTNLQLVNRNLILEQQGNKKLLQAKNIIMLAKTRGDTARSLQAWQKVKATWQTAIAILGSIDKTTTAYREAQQLLGDSRTRLATISDRATKEQIAAQAFAEATSKGNQAQRSVQQNQLSQALTNWNQALNSAKQVPGGTQYYTQVQPMIASYTSAIQQTGAKLKAANVLQKARLDLNRTCSGKIQVCKYALNNKLILVQLTPGYEQEVERNYISAKLQNNSNQVGVAVDYHKLKQALQAISDKADIPLQVYESDGSQLQNYKPK